MPPPPPAARAPTLSRAGLVAAQVVEIQSRGGLGRYGSGYRLGPRLVLTARHVVGERDGEGNGQRIGHDNGVGNGNGNGVGNGIGEADFDVRFGRWRADPLAQAPATVVWRGESADLALLRLTDVPDGLPDVRPPDLGDLLPSAGRTVPFVAEGFPWHTERQSPAGLWFREADPVAGSIHPDARSKTGELELRRDGRPHTLGESWQGMSGAAVFCHDLLTGIVARAETKDTPLRAVRVAQALGGGPHAPFGDPAESPGSADRFRELLAADGVSVRLHPVRRQCDYAARVDQILAACPVIGSRDAELAAMREFVRSARPYAWHLAPPWGGKTTLAAHFAATAPEDVDVVPFFVSRAGGQQTKEYFQAVCDQLAALLDETTPVHCDANAMRALWRRAQRRTEDLGRHLVLLVDGLDENTEAPPIAVDLPPDPGAAGHVLLFSRAYPDVPPDVAADHPIRHPERCPRIVLSQIPEARTARANALSDLSAHLSALRPTARAVLGALAAVGPLSIDETEELLRRTGRDVDHAEVKDAFTRTAARVLRPPADAPRGRYAFAHDTLRATTADEVGAAEVARCREALHAWAAEHAARGWQDDTPALLVDGYPTFLSDTGDHERLAALPTPERIRLLRRRAGHDSDALRELDLALEKTAAATGPDFAVIARLAVRRARLTAPASGDALDVAVAWAETGFLARAEHHSAQLAGHPRLHRLTAAISLAAAGEGDWERAERWLGRMPVDGRDCVLRVELAGVAEGQGEVARARGLLHAVASAPDDNLRLQFDPVDLMRTLVRAAGRLEDPELGELAFRLPDVRDELSDAVIAAGTTIGVVAAAAQVGWQFLAPMAAVIGAMTTIVAGGRRLLDEPPAPGPSGDETVALPLKESEARALTDPLERAHALADLADDGAAGGSRTLLLAALAAAEEVPDGFDRIRAATRCARSAARAGDLDMVDRCTAIAASGADRARMMLDAAGELTRTDPGAAGELLAACLRELRRDAGVGVPALCAEAAETSARAARWDLVDTAVAAVPHAWRRAEVLMACARIAHAAEDRLVAGRLLSRAEAAGVGGALDRITAGALIRTAEIAVCVGEKATAGRLLRRAVTLIEQLSEGGAVRVLLEDAARQAAAAGQDRLAIDTAVRSVDAVPDAVRDHRWYWLLEELLQTMTPADGEGPHVVRTVLAIAANADRGAGPDLVAALCAYTAAGGLWQETRRLFDRIGDPVLRLQAMDRMVVRLPASRPLRGIVYEELACNPGVAVAPFHVWNAVRIAKSAVARGWWEVADAAVAAVADPPPKPAVARDWREVADEADPPRRAQLAVEIALLDPNPTPARLSAASDLVAQEIDRQRRAALMTQLGTHAYAAGDQGCAEQQFRRAWRSTAGIKGLRWRFKVRLDIATAVGRCRELRGAAETLFANLARALDRHPDWARERKAFVVRAVRARLWTVGIRCARAEPDPRQRYELLLAIARLLDGTRAGRLLEGCLRRAVSAALELPGAADRNSALRAVAEAAWSYRGCEDIAIRSVRHVHDPVERCDLAGRLVRTADDTGRPEDACRARREFVAAAFAVPPQELRSALVLLRNADIFQREGDNQAAALWELAETVACACEHAYARRLLFASSARHGEVTTAVSVLTREPGLFEPVSDAEIDDLAQAFHALARARQVSAVEDAVRSVPTPRRRVLLRYHLADALLTEWPAAADRAAALLDDVFRALPGVEFFTVELWREQTGTTSHAVLWELAAHHAAKFGWRADPAHLADLLPRVPEELRPALWAQAFAAAAARDRREDRSHILRDLGEVAIGLRDDDTLERCITEGMAVARELTDPVEMRAAQFLCLELADLARLTGGTRRAADAMVACLPDPHEKAAWLVRLTRTVAARGDVRVARDLLTATATTARQVEGNGRDDHLHQIADLAKQIDLATYSQTLARSVAAAGNPFPLLMHAVMLDSRTLPALTAALLDEA